MRAVTRSSEEGGGSPPQMPPSPTYLTSLLRPSSVVALVARERPVRSPPAIPAGQPIARQVNESLPEQRQPPTIAKRKSV